MIPFGILDVIDILAVAWLLYYVYTLMKASRSLAIFHGIIIFIVTWILVTQFFEMRLLGSILDKLINVGAVALIILFQEEIRQFLSGIGLRQNFWSRFFSRTKSEDLVHRKEILPIVMACISMSKQKVGALIIIERRVGLSGVIHSGEIVNADINQRLIENIFFKNSPLHDGAMVVSHKRIKAAGCILPVSHDTDIPKALGLRHRAALGISQQSDCLAIIVSEETGGISIAENGQFHLRLTAEELESTLTELWGKK